MSEYKFSTDPDWEWVLWVVLLIILFSAHLL